MAPDAPKEYDHFVSAPPRRIGALGIVRNPDGDVLMVRKNETSSKPRPWYHPGGCVEANEPIKDGLIRVARAKLGLALSPGRLLAVHHMYEEDHGDYVSVEGFNFLFDCGVLPEDTEFTLGGDAVGTRWMNRSELLAECAPFTAQRTLSALAALDGGEVELLTGHPPTA